VRLLGIDYGSKRVGIALGDSEVGMAFPNSVLPSDDKLIDRILEIVSKEKVQLVVLGESKDYNGNDNLIAGAIRKFKEEFEKVSSVPVVYEPEFMTSLEASRIQGEGGMLDASAASIILQSYMDKNKSK